MVQHWVKELQSVTGLAPATIVTIYVIFACVMRGPVRDGYIRKTPCDDIRLPEVRPTVVRLLTPQVLALADAVALRYVPQPRRINYGKSAGCTALAEGVPISEAYRWLGHKSITTTADLYGHLVPEAGPARDALDRAFTRR
jgi:hypothetical protein